MEPLRFALLALALLPVLSVLAAPPKSVLVVPPAQFNSIRVGCVLIGRSDVPLDAYVPLARSIQSAFGNASAPIDLWVGISNASGVIDIAIDQLKVQGNVSSVFLMGHSMTLGGIEVQQYARKNPNATSAVVLLSGFLQRVQRPGVRQCLTEVKYEPKASFKYPLGYLKSGLHNCFGPNTIDFPVPTLTLSGDLDGVVRITRVAEAYYTQQVLQTSSAQRSLFPVTTIEGMNHGSLLAYGDASLPPSVRANDLKADVAPAAARSQVAALVAPWVGAILEEGAPSTNPSSKAFFGPLTEAFVEMEGNWFFTGHDDEHGSSRWSAMAQEWMAQPLPKNFSWETTNANHLLSDEEWIPPYYRHKHRPQINVTGPSSLSTATVLQQRFIEISPWTAGYGLDGWEIIKEEKLNILTAIPDNGAAYTSTIELATKLASRQLVFNLTGFPSPASLDDGNRCMDINQRAYDWALDAASPAALARFEKFGIPMKMMPDLSPTIPAGPWWIWTYMKYDMKAGAMEVSSYKAFFSLSANKYGAGNHYCKLLSPARALEWVYIDSLRTNMHS